MRPGPRRPKSSWKRGPTLQLGLREGKLESISQAQTAGVGIRTIVSRKLSFVHTSDFGRDALTQTIAKAVALAEQASPSEFNKLPTEKPRRIVMEIFDPQMRSVPIKRKIES